MGVTINTQNGRVMFPVLEPFGTSLSSQITDPALARRYSYQELYDSTITLAREFPEFNRFTIRGSYKSSVSSEISLGAFNLPQGSVRVTAGAQQLQEGVDYEVDYNIGRVKILNEAILNSGNPIRVSFEDNTLFGFQTKTLLGVRADYEVNKDFNIGGTYLHLFERPFTQKVNIGDDPINNRIYGLDVNYSKEAPWLTKIVDRIPLIDTKAPSSLTFQAEVAALDPGHASAINQGQNEDGDTDKGGTNYIDDFEGSTSSFDLRTPPNAWVLASVPQGEPGTGTDMFPESQLINDKNSGVNRGLLNWYRIDQSVRGGATSQYAAAIPQTEVFPNRVVVPGESTIIQSFDMTFYPNERGPYNFDIPGGTAYSAGMDMNGRLLAPETRWGGVMRSLTTTNFEAANIEYIEFWMLSPFLDGSKGSNPELYIDLGNISEDILRDSRKFFENGLPRPDSDTPTDTTTWGRIPRTQAITNAFDNEESVRLVQDVGLDGLDDEAERIHFADYINDLNSGGVNTTEIVKDPSNDNFLYYRDDLYEQNGANVFERYKKFNNPQGNSQSATAGQQGVQSATNLPDSEDLNRDNTLNETEAYFRYKVPLQYDGSEGMQFNEFVIDTIDNGDPVNRRIWYRVKVPLDQFSSKVGGIQDFRSMRFIRLFMKGFNRQSTLRFARLELVRNQWRRYRRSLKDAGAFEPPFGQGAVFDVNAVNIEENSSQVPFGYILPPGIEREQSLGAFPDALQNEQALSMEICNLEDGDAKAIYKIINFDMRVFEQMKMFVHAESQEMLEPGDLKIFMRLGSDFEKNYYEYEIPLEMSSNTGLSYGSAEYKNEVWKAKNSFDLDFEIFKNLKVERNQGANPLNVIYEKTITNPNDENGTCAIKVKGNPNLGLVKGIMIGVRNTKDDGLPHCAEIWVNELRVNGLDEKGGYAALARLDLKMADFGGVTLSGNYSSIGYGALDQKLKDRSREEVMQYDVATNLELGKFLPEESGIKIPFYASYSSTIRTPEYDPYDLDIPLKEKLAAETDGNKRDSIRQQAEDFTSIKSINFTNVRKVRTGKDDREPRPWDIENFSFTYAFTQTNKHNPIILSDKLDNHHGAVDYNYSRKPLYITPLKKLIKKR